MAFVFQILLSYYNRPILLRNALRSILESHDHYPYWELAFGDDGSVVPGRPIVEELLGDFADRIIYRQSGMTIDDKLRDGLTMGTMANEAIRRSSADAALVLCDDDQLHPDYLCHLSHYFQSHPQVPWCYSRVLIYNPLLEARHHATTSVRYDYWTGPINPAGKLDISQVAWRLSCNKEAGAWFPETTKFVPGRPWTHDTDRSLFEQLYARCGPCHPTGFVSQFKGVHDYQLVWHKNVGEAELRSYDTMCRQLAGVSI